MKFTRVGASLAMTAVAALALAACTPANETPAQSGAGTLAAEQLSGSLTGSGATSQGTAQAAWASGYLAVQPGVTVNYGGGGSGQGRTDFTSGTSQFAGSDRAFKMDEIAKGGFAGCAEGSDLVEIPAYISPIAVAFNLPGVQKLQLDAATLAGIFAGKITTWNAPEITATNPGVTLPADAITPVHRSDKSGTTGNFTDYLGKAAKDVWTWGSVEEWPGEIAGGEAANQTDGVQASLKNANTIGYLDASAAQGMTLVEVKVGDKFVALSPEAAAAVVDASKPEEGRAPTDLAIKLARDTAESGAYPIVLVSYLIGCAQYKDPEVGKLVQSYFNYVISAEGQQAAASAAHSAPISDALRGKAQTAVDAIK